MTRRISRLLSLLYVFAIITAGINALSVPGLKGRVNDYAAVLSSSTAGELEKYLAAVEKASGAQIVLLTIDSLAGEDLESYSLAVAEEWELGQAGEDNGALLLVAMAEKKIRIETGYGLEGDLTDAMSGYIIREAIVPEFKSGNFERGIAAGLQAMGGVVTGDISINADDIRESESQGGGGEGIPIFFIIFFLVIIFGRMGRYRHYRRRGMSPMTAFFLGSMMGGSSRRSGFGGSSGGFGGGGFSGGGGGFGGGGASGGW